MSSPVVTYDPDRFQVEGGNYICRLKEIKEKEPFDGPSKFGNSNNEPRWGWRFEIIGPAGSPMLGKIIEQNTGTYLSARSGLMRLLTMVMGRAPALKEQIDLGAFVGKDYQVIWAVNPNSETGKLHIATLMPVNAAMANTNPPGQSPPRQAAPPASAQRAPVPTPPAPASRAAQPAPAASPATEPSFWVDDGKAVELVPRHKVQAIIDTVTPEEGKSSENTVLLMAEDQTGGWRPASVFGFKSSIVF